jgi:hypothetical protein
MDMPKQYTGDRRHSSATAGVMAPGASGKAYRRVSKGSVIMTTPFVTAGNHLAAVSGFVKMNDQQ